MSRFRVLCAAIAVALLSWSHAMQGQRLPSRSGDLVSVRGDRVRVIVQSDARGLTSIAKRHARGLRRQLEATTVLELTRPEFAALMRDSSVAHVSKDLPVVADMSVTNQVTRAETVWTGAS